MKIDANELQVSVTLTAQQWVNVALLLKIAIDTGDITPRTKLLYLRPLEKISSAVRDAGIVAKLNQAEGA